MLTPEAKKLLAETIRGSAQDPAKGLREKLLRAIHDEADRRYRLSVPIADAGLDEAHRKRRERIAAWVDERARATKPKNDAERHATRARLLAQAEKEAAATLLNRLVLLRHLEALGLSRPAVLTGGWNSKGYREYREFAPTLCTNGTTDATEGYGTLLQLLFDELAVDLPGLFGDVGLTRLFPIPAATLREVVERLDDPGLASAWSDDTTLGWVYQYWNDPDREALDAKINDGGKIAPHEIASKTQMFTERYMVEWLLQNSLGLTWLAMCRKHGWTPDADRVLPALDARRAEWRAKREAGEVALDALMPIEGELEEHWKYYVPQPIPDDAVTHAPDSVRALKLLDPACGSGHFLVIAFDLLASLYREEARHRGQTITDRRDRRVDPREQPPRHRHRPARRPDRRGGALPEGAVASRRTRTSAELNLVAPALQLGNLPDDDPAVVTLLGELKREAGIPEEVARKLLSSLAGVDYLGSLLKVDAAVEGALKNVELEFERSTGQGDIFKGFPAQQVKLSVGEAKATVLDKLEQFLAKHSTAADLGLRLDGEQLAAGVRFVRIAKEGTYDVVVGNPPYQGITKTSQFEYVAREYPRGKADLYAAFLERGLQLARPGGISALLTMRGWMFLGQFAELRIGLLKGADLRLLGDVDRGAFEDVPDEVLATTMSVFLRGAPSSGSVALQPTPPEDRSRDGGRTARKRAAVLAQVGCYGFDPRGFEVIEGEPVVYWWSKEFLARYASAPKLGAASPARATQGLYNNTRFTRSWHEVSPRRISGGPSRDRPWTPFTNGSNGVAWFEPPRLVALWGSGGIEAKSYVSLKVGADMYRFANEQFFFRDDAVAFSMIGAAFSARRVARCGIFGDKGRSLFARSPAHIVCFLNSNVARFMMESLNPEHQLPGRGRESCGVVRRSGCKGDSGVRRRRILRARGCQRAVRRLLPPRPLPLDLRPGLGPARRRPPRRRPSSPLRARLRATRPRRLRLLRPRRCPRPLRRERRRHPRHRPSLGPPERHPLPLHRTRRQPRPPRLRVARQGLGGARRCRLAGRGPPHLPATLVLRLPQEALREPPHLLPALVGEEELRRLRVDPPLGGRHALRAARRPPRPRPAVGSMGSWTTSAPRAPHAGANKSKVEKRFTDVQKARRRAGRLHRQGERAGREGAAATGRQDDEARGRRALRHGPRRRRDGEQRRPVARSSSRSGRTRRSGGRSWPSATGKKDYDWSHLAARYFPTRVRAKCHEDPSLAVAHGCFWELHPAKAYAWELRLQDEIRADFTIDEPGSDAARCGVPEGARARSARDRGEGAEAAGEEGGGGRRAGADGAGVRGGRERGGGR